MLKLIFENRQGDCNQEGYTNPMNNMFVPSTLKIVHNQCQGKNGCLIAALNVKLADCQGKSASYLHVVYSPNTCDIIYNNSKFNFFEIFHG